MERWLTQAIAIGFDVASPCDVSTLKPMKQVREMCASDRCHAYNHNWTCPPNCGTLEECSEKIKKYRQGILLQTIGHMQKDIDTRCYRETELLHMENFLKFTSLIRQADPNALCLGAGGCRICKQCAFPEPCRFPEKAYSSMEGYGLFVTQVCRENNIPYYHGPRTITYSACVLFA